MQQLCSLGGVVRQYGGWGNGEFMLKSLKRIAIIGTVALAAVAATGTTWQTVAEKRDNNNFPPPGQLIDMGGYQLHMLKTGTRGPTGLKKPVVVLEAGL